MVIPFPGNGVLSQEDYRRQQQEMIDRQMRKQLEVMNTIQSDAFWQQQKAKAEYEMNQYAQMKNQAYYPDPDSGAVRAQQAAREVATASKASTILNKRRKAILLLIGA